MPAYPFSRYLNIRAAYFASFRSDGQKLAFLSDITGLPQVWQMTTPVNGKIPWPDQLTFEQDRVMGAWFSPAPGDHRLIYARDTGGDENAQLFLLDSSGGIEVPLTTGFEHCMHIPGEWSADGKSFLFAANRRHPALFDLYLQYLDGSPARMLWQNDAPGYLREMSFSPDGGRVLLTRDVSSFQADLLEVDLSSAAARLLNPVDEIARYETPRYLPGGRSAVVITDAGSDFLYAARIDLTTHTPTPLAAPNWDVESLALSPDGRLLAYIINVEGISELHLLDLATGSDRQSPRINTTPGVIGPYNTDEGRLVFSPDGSLLAFSFTSASRPSDVFLWDIEKDEVYPVTRASKAGLPADAFSVPQLVRYPTFDRDETGQVRTIPAWLYRPSRKIEGKLPVIVFVHGGPESQYRAILLPVIQYFVHRGYAVMCTNVRGSTGYGKAYSHLDDVEKRMDSVNDLAHAALWLKQQPAFDPDRIAVYGGSYGGFMVLSALTTYPDLWAAGVDIYGIANFVTFMERTSSYRRPHREAEYGSLERDRAVLEQVSPINHIDQIRVPLMVLHGRNDPRVPFHEAEQIVAALQQRGIPVELLTFDDEGHGIVKLKNKLVAYPAIVDFLEKYL